MLVNMQAPPGPALHGFEAGANALTAGTRPCPPVEAPSLPGQHRIEVLRHSSGASGRVTSGQAVCLTCHWEGPRRSGGSTMMLDADAAGHARTTSGRRSDDFIGG
jgi:hypothetical protein